MRVLVACEFSGTVREAFRKRGHDAWSADLLPAADRSPYHFQGDVLDVIGGGIVSSTHSNPYHWDLMIAHPPCTYLTVSGLHWNKRDPERAKKTEAGLEFVRRLLSAPITRIALENPVSCISSRIRKPDQTIQPYEFGADASKRTCLWLKGLPPLRKDPANRVAGRWVQHNGRAVERWANQTDSGQNRLAPSADRWALRSITYPGIAEAMAEQWGGEAIHGPLFGDAA